MTAPAALATDACQHEQWQATAKVISLTDIEDGPITGWTVELEATCVDCLTYMQWLGLPFDALPGRPTVTTPAAITLTLPCRPFVAKAREIGEAST